MNHHASDPPHPPIACTLGPAARADREALIRTIFSEAQRVELLADRLDARIQGTARGIRQVAELMVIERECCRFLRFEVTAEPDLGPIDLAITGPPGTGEVLRAWLPE